jgi:hypothetical protein
MYQENPWEKYAHLFSEQKDSTLPSFMYLFYSNDDYATNFLQRIINVELWHSKIRFFLIDYIKYSAVDFKELKGKMVKFLKSTSANSLSNSVETEVSLTKKSKSSQNKGRSKIKLPEAEEQLELLSNRLTEFMSALHFIRQMRESLVVNLTNIEKCIAS